eukprot:gene191-9818_t
MGVAKEENNDKEQRETLIKATKQTWKHIIDRGEIVGALFIDFRKAFDSIDHHILLEKLQGFGISRSAYEIIEDYLTDRYQFTEINGSRSQVGSITYGVPQESLLGPKLSEIFVNDLPEKISIHSTHIACAQDGGGYKRVACVGLRCLRRSMYAVKEKKYTEEGRRGQKRAEEGRRGQKRAEEGRRGQKRAEEGRRGEKRAEEGRRGQKRAEEGRRGQKRAEEGRRGQKRAEEGRRGQKRAEEGSAIGS